MPSAFEKYTDEKDDGRIKISSDQKITILKKYRSGISSIALAKEFHVSKTTILYWVNDDFREKMKQRTRARKRPYNKSTKESISRYCQKKRRLGFIKKI